ncbi:hypothetical protein [Nonomuraea gerenzanensis]|uniref:hypothetical protein n=1 Tax=Nonomuraea gerenzanensis TaxID=93944 RepID=UPI001CD9A01F|nr:hypothetical protein [Nonomuraea gerenzanensis]UBU18089.1 hypothetical protein LCN96_24610 [Nonomuraea gerenzanensis]
MRGRVLVWAGAVIAVAALAGLGVYLAGVGLDEADKLASVIGLFVAVAGLGVAAYGLITDRKSSGGGKDTPQRASASGERSIASGGDNSGTTFSGGGPVQNITASAQGATAQGAMFGNIINHYGGPPVAGSLPSPDSRTDLDVGED